MRRSGSLLRWPALALQAALLAGCAGAAHGAAVPAVPTTPRPRASATGPAEAATTRAEPAAAAATFQAAGTPAQMFPAGSPLAQAPESVRGATPWPSATAAPVTAAPALTRPADPPEPRLVARENANVRRGPGIAYPVAGGLRRGESYPVLAQSPDGAWLQFDYHGTPAWVAADLVALVGAAAAIPVARSIPLPPLPTATAAPPAAPADPVIADLVARINEARVAAGLNRLAWTPALAQAAAVQVEDMAAHGFFSHTGSDGSDVTARMQRAGYKPAYWGEVLTHVNGGAEAAFGQFWGSPHHHDILLGGNFQDIGAAWIRDPADGQFNYFAVVFGRR